MTAPSRRAVVAAGLGALLVGCGGGGGGGGAASARADGSPSPSPSASKVKSARPLGRSEPVALRIPAIEVDTPVMRLGLARDGSVQVPPLTADDRAGWYRHSPTPGQVGPSVILGHVTVGSYGDGVFRDLGRLRRGDGIVVRLENGAAAEFGVTEVRTVAKAEFPADDVYGDVDRPELRLITCGGPRRGDWYRDNVIAFAVLRSASG